MNFSGMNALLGRFGGYMPPQFRPSQSPPQQVPQSAPQSTWNDPRRMARDPRIQRGAHPQQQRAGISPYQNALMQRFGQPSWAPQTQGYRTGSSYTQGQGPRYSPPPQQQAFQRFGNFFNRQANQPTAPRTMGKPMGRQGRMY